jgi:hypothetical protein
MASPPRGLRPDGASENKARHFLLISWPSCRHGGVWMEHALLCPVGPCSSRHRPYRPRPVASRRAPTNRTLCKPHSLRIAAIRAKRSIWKIGLEPVLRRAMGRGPLSAAKGAFGSVLERGRDGLLLPFDIAPGAESRAKPAAHRRAAPSHRRCADVESARLWRDGTAIWLQPAQ